MREMTVLLYDYRELDERASKHLRVWKVWHTILYILAAIFGILNYMFLQNAMYLIDNNCVLYPRKLEFHWVELPKDLVLTDLNSTIDDINKEVIDIMDKEIKNITENAQDNSPFVNKTTDSTKNSSTINSTTGGEDKKTVKREAIHKVEIIEEASETNIEDSNVTIVTENRTSRLVLDTSRTLFAKEARCQFAEYMPLMSTIAGILWATLFIMCPGGGKPRTGLQQPWSILTPALLFALLLVGLTGHSFTVTNGGLQAFCTAFHRLTNATTCSSVNPFLERSWGLDWGIGGRAAAARAASAGVLASWACAAALLLARCLAAPDFMVRRTRAYIIKDPCQKVTPYLKKSSGQHSKLSLKSSPSKKDTASVRSDPTTLTELVTASVEREPDSPRTSVSMTPLKGERHSEDIEMVYSPRELTD